MIVCLRTVLVPPEWRERYLAWIEAGRRIRQDHGILAAEHGAHSFDAPGAQYTHQPSPDGTGEWCTFETLIGAHDLGGNRALLRLASIVHAADVAADVDSDPLGHGLLAIGVGGLDVEPDDQLLLEHGMFVYDALYAWCAHQVGASPA